MGKKDKPPRRDDRSTREAISPRCPYLGGSTVYNYATVSRMNKLRLLII